MMIQPILARNKQTFQAYSRFRKQVFTELSPKAGEAVLYLLPWLLSINHEDCPGYVADLESPFKVFNVDIEREIRHREPAFQRIFGIKASRSLLRTGSRFIVIQGLYTIGSVGSTGQTPGSDCDIWVCCDKTNFSESAWRQLHQKVNLIKDWMDMNLKMHVFFFISDLTDIRMNRFGSVDTESSGSTQRNLLKEEFYRTCIMICGKIPLWWLCYDSEKYQPLEYQQALKEIERSPWAHYDVIDLGDLAAVDQTEYFGAALWQLNKSLTSPLKSIIKMVQVKMLLDTSQPVPTCNLFRGAVLCTESEELFPDPSVFTMTTILDSYDAENDPKNLTLLKECFYLRCEFRPQSNQFPLKNRLAKQFLKDHAIDIRKRIRLSRFARWDFNAQINLGNRLFRLMLKSYQEISSSHAVAIEKINQQDFTIIGRKILTTYQKKENKVQILQKPIAALNLPYLTLQLKDDQWQLFAGNNKKTPLVSNTELLVVVAFIVWNDLFEPNKIRMEPNASSVTLQEILNLSRKLSRFMGALSAFDDELSLYLKKERIVKLLVVVSFERAYYEKNINDFGVIYLNSWGELFVRRFNSPRKLETFIKNAQQGRRQIETNYYVQRNSTYYEKMIERTKRIIFSSF
ncbi:MAG: class I adenylate cyclase [Deltaproteobacteria bacterium]|nr:class I adenylate cyclase [Deltaproteobacteria bacterium]